ncbi:hypothetical protein HPB49_012334 [Dermacentor silvarum]|uniref:Uncharacterized protein n=1 Tax=Dermacentor silvarum TaxID=543639 RepID=A0ACB8CF73_DERSI|nr:hypothetical protein HPB49_012334 [Dermacentor silvarum]
MTLSSQVTISPSPYTEEALQRREGVNLTAYEAFFNVAAEHFSKAWGNGNPNTSAVNFSTMYDLENDYAIYYHKKGKQEVIFDDNLAWVQHMSAVLKAELVQAMPDRVYPQSRLKMAASHEEFVNWVIVQTIDHHTNVELVLGWHVVLHVASLTNRELAVRFHELVTGSVDPAWQHKKHCFDLTKRYLGVASIRYVSQQRFTDSVRDDVDRMARDVRRTYFGTLQKATYDWKDLTVLLEFIENALSGDIQQILYSMGDIGNDIVANVRSMAVSALNTEELQRRKLMAEELARTHEEPFAQRLDQHDVSVLPSALRFPYYEQNVPTSIMYAPPSVGLR